MSKPALRKSRLAPLAVALASLAFGLACASPPSDDDSPIESPTQAMEEEEMREEWGDANR